MSFDPENFKPNEEYLQEMVSMGISKAAAEEALFCTGNKSVDDAVNYVFSEDNDVSDGCIVKTKVCSLHDVSDDYSSDEDHQENFYKMTFIVNYNLKMGIGKIAAQVAHACLGLYREMLDHNLEELLHHWECVGEKKIVLRGDNTEHLMNLYEKAKTNCIPCHIVRDAGHTQIPAGSVTVLSLFGLEEEIDKISGKLKLL